MDCIEELDDPAVPVVRACDALGVSRATIYRSTRPSSPPQSHSRAPSPRRVSDEERAALMGVLHSPEFVDQPPHEVYATLLSRGVYLASIRTMYRLLAERGETQERRNQRRALVHPKPSLTATAPHQVWTWDITKLATTAVGVFLHAYVIIDLFSRYVVGWMVAAKECKHLAAQLFAETIARHGIEPGLTVHADRGSAMKSDTLAQLLATLGVERSFSRPHVSDDNAFSEAQFKTLKYQPDYPGRFLGEVHARGWLGPFFGWHNDEHHHSGLALFTPADVFFGRVDRIRAVRQAALDEAYRAHPERFPRKAPRVALPPSEVSINPVTSSAVSVGNDDSTTAPFAAQDGLGHGVSATETSPSADRALALTSRPSQRAAVSAARPETALGALPASTHGISKPARRQPLHS
jgi:putative transposase